MTVIATDGRTIAGDGLTLCGWTIDQTDTVKVLRLADGRVFGTTGLASDKIVFGNYLAGKSDKPDFSGRDTPFSALVLNTDGSVDWYGAECIAVPASIPTAIGCGSDFARAALVMGATSKEAVALACKLSAGCGGTITVMSIAGGAE
jgi:ATP-dependent protease HslVU (ClpYQ) peptidase subunit